MRLATVWVQDVLDPRVFPEPGGRQQALSVLGDKLVLPEDDRMSPNPR